MRAVFLTVVACGLVLHQADNLAGQEPGAATAREPFQPAEISIGEPLQVPARLPDDPATALPPATSAAPRQDPEAGTGWIGLTVDDKVVTGRLVVVDATPGGPADRAGIRLQDQLLAINGMPLRSADQLAAALASIAPGDAVKVAVGRADRIDEITLNAVPRPAKPPVRDWQAADSATPAAARQPPEPAPKPSASPAPFARQRQPSSFEPPVPAPAPAASAAPPRLAEEESKGRTALGVRTMPVDPSVQARFNLPEPAGALVIGVVHDLPASKAGVPPGSVIVALDNQPVRSPNELTRIVTTGPIGRPVTLQYILPGGEQRRAEVSLQSLEVPLERALVGPER